VRACACTPRQVATYQGRVSGPLLDRIDLHVEVAALPYAEITGPPGEGTEAVSARVAAARGRQGVRGGGASPCNADLGGSTLRTVAAPDAGGRRLLETAMERLGLTGRGHDRVLRVARTIADLEGADRLSAAHVAEALQFRGAAP